MARTAGAQRARDGVRSEQCLICEAGMDCLLHAPLLICRIDDIASCVRNRERARDDNGTTDNAAS